MAKLGENQKLTLDAMRRHDKVWYDGCGWCCNSYSFQVRVLKSLHKRGFVSHEQTAAGKDKYTITAAGLAAIGE